MAEAIANRAGRGAVRAFSAGSQPGGKVNPHALELLIDLGYATADLRSKSWHEFTQPGAPAMDLVITLCDEAAGESCPVWPGHPAREHWSIPDPAKAKDARAVRAAFVEAYRMIEARVHALLDLPLAALDNAELQRRLADISKPSAPSIPVWSL